MWIEKLALFCLVVFAIIGTAQIAIILHEYSHFNDFKVLNVTDGQICGLVLPTKWVNWSYFVDEPAGYYEFRINDSSNETVKEYQKIDKNTEVKAYAISVFVFAFFLLCYFIINFARVKDKEKILDQGLKVAEKDFYIHQLEAYISSLDNEDYSNQGYNDT